MNIYFVVIPREVYVRTTDKKPGKLCSPLDFLGIEDEKVCPVVAIVNTNYKTKNIARFKEMVYIESRSES